MEYLALKPTDQGGEAELVDGIDKELIYDM